LVLNSSEEYFQTSNYLVEPYHSPNNFSDLSEHNVRFKIFQIFQKISHIGEFLLLGLGPDVSPKRRGIPSLNYQISISLNFGPFI
jgi:hypothetical protein